MTFAVVWAYVTITGDETGEKLLPITKKVSLYPFTAPPYDTNKYQNAINDTRNIYKVSEILAVIILSLLRNTSTLSFSNP